MLAFLVYWTSSGLVINRHYCQKELKSTQLFFDAKPCHGKSKIATCPAHDHPENDDCCDDKKEYVKLDQQQYLNAHPVDLLFGNMAFTVGSFFHYRTLLSVDKKTIHFLNFKPPLIICDLQVGLQTFLC